MERAVTALDSLKEMRWNGRSRGHFEAWYATMNQVSSKAGFWIRYAMVAPRTGENRAQVWFTSLVPGASEASVAAVQEYPPDQFNASSAPFALRVGPSSLESGRMTGMMEIAGVPVTWDLVYEAVTDPLRNLPEVFYKTRWVASSFLTPHPFMMIGGKIQIGFHTFILNADPGQQGHIWGRSHAEEWVWFHCSSFIQEGGNPIPAYVTGVTARQRLLGRVLLPPLSFGHLVWNEKHVQIRPETGWEKRWNGPWAWKGVAGDEEVKLSLVVPWTEMVLAPYRDPAGRTLYCHHADVADCTVEFRGPRKPPRVFRSTRMAHLELGSRSPDARVARKVLIQT